MKQGAGFLLLLSIIFLSDYVFAQSEVTPIIVNKESEISLFSQSEARIFPDSNKGFVVAWLDSRLGDTKSFAQKFNPDLTKIGTNYKTFSNTLILYSTIGKSFSFYDSTYSYYYFPWDERAFTHYVGVLHDNSMSKSFNYGGYQIPNFIEFWSGEKKSVVKYKNDFISVFNIVGRFKVNRFYEDLTDSLIAENDKFSYSDISNTSISVNSKGIYAVAYYNQSENSWGNSFDSSGIYVQIFSDKDSLLTKKMIKQRLSDYFSSFPQIIATSVSDTLFQIFVSDSCKLESFKINKLGDLLESKTFPLTLEYCEYGWWDEGVFTLSNLNNNKRALIINNTDNKYRNLCYFDENGDIIGEPIVDSTAKFEHSSQIFLDGNQNLIFTKTVDRDVYLYKCNNFEVIDSIKINDDVSGSNEARPLIKKAENKGFYVHWVNDLNKVGQLISNSGELISENEILQDETFQIFDDGCRISNWSKTYNDGMKQIGFKIVDKNANIVAYDSVAGSNGSNSVRMNFSIIDDSEFLVVFYANSQNYIAKYSKNEGKIAQKEIAGNSLNESTVIFIDKDFFYVKISNILYKYDYNLNLLLKTENYPSINKYLGQSKFLSVFTDYEFYYYEYAIIYDENGTELQPSIDLGINNKGKVGVVKSGQFLTFSASNNKLVANTFNSDGEKVKSNFVVSTLENTHVRDLNFAVNDNKIMFTWSGCKINESSYDIYSAIYDLDLVTDIYENNPMVNFTFNLEQNFPNPFNPSTVIKYSIPRGTELYSVPQTTLKIFDILGREVATLINTKQSAGSYEVEFNANNLSSGIYYYRLQSGSFTETKKMLLIK